jgi:hypothetical protein
MIGCYAIKGTISLVAPSDEIISAKSYKGRTHRNRIISSWMRLYAANYFKCSIQISPYYEEHYKGRSGIKSKYTYNGARYTGAALAKLADINYKTMKMRLRKWIPGQPLEPFLKIREVVMLTQDGKTMSIPRWAKKIGIDKAVIYLRLKAGWTVEKTLDSPIMRRRKYKVAA